MGTEKTIRIAGKDVNGEQFEKNITFKLISPQEGDSDYLYYMMVRLDDKQVQWVDCAPYFAKYGADVQIDVIARDWIKDYYINEANCQNLIIENVTKDIDGSIPNIREERIWHKQSVREICLEHSLYTAGDNAEYAEMLHKVESLYPDKTNVYIVAQDIYQHSDKTYTVSDIMNLLEQKIATIYHLDERTQKKEQVGRE